MVLRTVRKAAYDQCQPSSTAAIIVAGGDCFFDRRLLTPISLSDTTCCRQSRLRPVFCTRSATAERGRSQPSHF